MAGGESKSGCASAVLFVLVWVGVLALMGLAERACTSGTTAGKVGGAVLWIVVGLFLIGTWLARRD